jgi:hypothetical protein
MVLFATGHTFCRLQCKKAYAGILTEHNLLHDPFSERMLFSFPFPVAHKGHLGRKKFLHDVPSGFSNGRPTRLCQVTNLPHNVHHCFYVTTTELCMAYSHISNYNQYAWKVFCMHIFCNLKMRLKSWLH